METRKIDLAKYRGQQSSLFTGRPQGELARQELNLSKNDIEKDKIVFIIPNGTSSINPSFYLGLLYESIKNLGFENFENFYTFEIADSNPEIKLVLQSNLEDGKRNALNTLQGKSGLGRFLKK